MKKKAITLLMMSALVLTIGACGSSSNSNSEKTEETTAPVEKEEPTDLTGTWQSENNNGSYHEAVITDSTIEINWVSDNGDTKSLYWAGSFTPPTEAVDNYSWTSENDTEKTASAMMASSDETKEFTYEKGIISYEASALGTTTTMKLEKQ